MNAKATVKSNHIKPDHTTGQFAKVNTSKFLGVTKDGVRILRPKFSPRNFTVAELREAVTKVLAKSA